MEGGGGVGGGGCGVWVKDGGLYGWRDVCVEVGSSVEVGRVCWWGGGVWMKVGCEDGGMHGHSRETSKRVWPVFLQLLTSFVW